MATSDSTTIFAGEDVINRLAGITADSLLGQLRDQRPEIVRYAEGSYRALLEPADLAGVSRIERELIQLCFRRHMGPAFATSEGLSAQRRIEHTGVGGIAGSGNASCDWAMVAAQVAHKYQIIVQLGKQAQSCKGRREGLIVLARLVH